MNFAHFFVSTDNKPHCFYSIKNDVNAWKQANNALRAREQGSNLICVTGTRLRRRKNHHVVVKFQEARGELSLNLVKSDILSITDSSSLH